MSKHDDSLDPRVGEALDRIAPRREAPAGLLAGARRKRRNRRMLAGGAAALVAVALMVPGAAFLARQGGLTANPASTPTQVPVAAATDHPCLQGEHPTPSGGIVEGADRAWLCGDFLPGDTMGRLGPLEALETDPDRLVAAWNDFEALPADIACTAEYSLTYTLVFEYADGAQRALQGELHGCRATTDGMERRGGGQELHDLALELWNEQREGSRTVVPYVPCLAAGTIMGLELEQVTRGALCAVDGGFDFADGVELDELLVVRIRDSVIREATAVDPLAQRVTDVAFELELVNQFADPLRLATADGSAYEWWADDQFLRWEPDPELAEAIARYLDVAPSGGSEPAMAPPATEPADPPLVQPWIGELCDLTGDGVFDSPLDVGQDPDAIWICPVPLEGFRLDFVPPAEQLVFATSEAMQLLRRLEPIDPMAACEDDLGVTYNVVHQYADGSQRVVQVEDFGCQSVTAGEQVLAGGGEYLEELLELWRLERENSEEMYGRPGPLCPELHSLLPVDHTERFIAGSVCRTTSDASGMTITERELDPDLAFAISAELQDATILDEPTFELDDRTLVLLTMHGDPFTLSGTTDGRWIIWTGDAEWLATTLTDDVEAQLDALLRD